LEYVYDSVVGIEGIRLERLRGEWVTDLRTRSEEDMERLR
jgi:hypothetical protein